MRTKTKLPRVLKIHQIDEFKITCVFNTGEYKTIDFKKLFKEWDIREDSPEYPLLNSDAFKQVIVNDSHTLAWPNIAVSFTSFDQPGERVAAVYEASPEVLYEAGEPFPRSQPNIGELIKKERLQAGLTQTELAQKSGTTKNYISRLENGRSDIEVGTLQKIVELGLGEELQISFTRPAEKDATR